MKCRSCTVLVVLALAWLAVVLIVGCGHRSDIARNDRQQEATTAWHATTAATKTETAQAEQTQAVHRQRRVITRQPDGTVIDDQLLEQVIDLATWRYGGSASASGSITGEAKAKLRERGERERVTHPGLSWWLWALMVLAPAAGLFILVRRFVWRGWPW